MTSTRQHVDKALHNEALIGPLSILGTHPDWVITAAFYASVHWARAFLAVHGAATQPGQQIKYREFENEFKKLRIKGVPLGSLRSDFEGILEMSFWARYDCYDMKWYEDRAQDAKDYLQSIRAHVTSHGLAL